MSRQTKPAHPTPNEVKEIKVRKARLEELRQVQMHISKKENALRLQLTRGIAEDNATQKSFGAIKDQLEHPCSSGLWEQYKATQQEQESQQLIVSRRMAARSKLEEEIKGVHAQSVAMEQETIAIWGRLGKIMPFGSVNVGCWTVPKDSGNIW